MNFESHDFGDVPRRTTSDDLTKSDRCLQCEARTARSILETLDFTAKVVKRFKMDRLLKTAESACITADGMFLENRQVSVPALGC